MLHYGNSLESWELRGRDGPLGKLKDIYFDDHAWKVRYLVVTTGGLLHRHHVLISPASVRQIEPQENQLRLDLSREQVRNSPPSNVDEPVSRQHEMELHSHYGWVPYWGAVDPWGALAVPELNPAARPKPIDDTPNNRFDAMPEKHGDPHLRSLNELRGYGLEAYDGIFGHVHDLLIEERDWNVPYVVVNTHRLMPGGRIALPVQHVKGISWADHRLLTSLTIDKIQAAPELEEVSPMSGEEEAKLRDHFMHRTQVPR